MNSLKIPSELEGDWTNALFLTFGADLPFFERALWREFSARCRRKVVLVDGRQFRDACRIYARGATVRFMNRRYAVGGVRHPKAVHAKAILLTGEERGRLLVGSGNLGIQGYASGGELFTRYEYGPDEPDALPAFHAAKEVLDHLVGTEMILPALAGYVQQILEATPWLYVGTDSSSRPVRHNLRQSFLAQLEHEVADDPVEEVWIASPFFDPGTVALHTLLNAFRPERLRILLQPWLASVDGEALRRTLDAFGGDALLQEARRKDDPGTYLHAKLILLKLRDRSVCLQGSANLSQVAMLRTVEYGNLELCNLHTGPRGAFDHLFDLLEIRPDPIALDNLRIHGPDEDDNPDEADGAFELLGGELQDHTLRLYVRGKPPEATAWRIELDLLRGPPLEIPDARLSDNGTFFGVELTAFLLQGFEKSIPVRLLWDSPDGTQRSEPIFIVHRTSLDQEFGREFVGEALQAVGSLDLNEKGLEELIRELDAILVADRDDVQRLWRAPSNARPAPFEASPGDESSNLRYEDVDYEQLRNHPRIQQYLTSRQSERAFRSQIQVVLASILGHLSALTQPNPVQLREVARAIASEESADTEDEQEEIEIRKIQRRSNDRRKRDLFMRFVRRYLSGLDDPGFRECVGVHVMTKNYTIFSHLLLELSKKDWFEQDQEFLLASLLHLWLRF